MSMAGNAEIFRIIISEQVADSRLSLDVVKSEDKAIFHKLNLILPAAYMRTDMYRSRVFEHIPVIAAVDDIITIVPVAHRVHEDEQDITGLIRSPVSGAEEPEDIRFLLPGFRLLWRVWEMPILYNKLPLFLPRSFRGGYVSMTTFPNY